MPLDANPVASLDKYLKALDVKFERSEPKCARAVMPLSEHHKNAWGAAHGGVIASLVDAAFGAAANDSRDHAVVTLSTAINYLRPGLKSPLTAEAKALHIGSHVVNYEVKVLDADGLVIAQALVSGYVTDFPLQPRDAQM